MNDSIFCYKQAFNKAKSFSLEEGFLNGGIDDFEVCKKLHGEKLYNQAVKTYWGFMEKIHGVKAPGQCVTYSYWFMKELREKGIPCYLTFGYVKITDKMGSKLCFKHELDYIRRIARQEEPLDNINIHAWITFPDFSIMDISFLDSYVTINGLGKSNCFYYKGFSGDFKIGGEFPGVGLEELELKFFPTVVGEAFAEKCLVKKIL